MEIEIIKGISECKKIWKRLSKGNTIWNLWEVVYSLYDKSIHEPYFIILKEKKKEIGVVPLWFDKEVKIYYYFGGIYPENRVLWFDINLFPEVFEKMPGITKIFDFNLEIAKKIMNKFPRLSKYFPESDCRYYLNLKKCNYSLDEYMKSFNKKHRKNFKNDLKNLEKFDYQLVWETTEHFDEFISLSIKRFEKESDMTDSQFVKEFKKFLNVLKKKNLLHTIIVMINGKVEGIEFGAFFNRRYYILNGSHNREYKNLGKLLIIEHIKKAASLKADIVDFLVGEANWKQLWNFEKEPTYDFIKQ